MEMHHKLRRDPSWDPRGCNLCGQVSLQCYRVALAYGKIIFVHGRLTMADQKRVPSKASATVAAVAANSAATSLQHHPAGTADSWHPPTA